jgi:hypothetical protein
MRRPRFCTSPITGFDRRPPRIVENADFTLKVFSNANHALTQAESGSDDETERARGQAPDLFDTLRSWLSKRVTLRSVP